MILAAGLIIIPFLKVLVKDPELPGGLNLYACYLIFLFNSVVSYLLYGYMNSLPLAFQRRDILSRVDMSMAVLRCIMESMLLISSDNFYLYLLSMPLITILRNLLTATVMRRLYPDITCRGKLHKEQIVDLHKRVYGLFLNKLTVSSRNGIDTICISAFISLAAAGIYSNYYIIMAGLISVSIMICQSMMASVGNSIVTESRDKNYTNMRSFDFIYMMVAGWATACLICLYQPFISLWLGVGMKLGPDVVLGLGLYFYILKAGDIRWVFHEGAGLWYECRFITIGETIANLVLNILLCSVWGIAGIVYATVITVFVTNMLLFPEVLFRMNPILSESEGSLPTLSLIVSVLPKIALPFRLISAVESSASVLPCTVRLPFVAFSVRAEPFRIFSAVSAAFVRTALPFFRVISALELEMVVLPSTVRFPVPAAAPFAPVVTVSVLSATSSVFSSSAPS